MPIEVDSSRQENPGHAQRVLNLIDVVNKAEQNRQAACTSEEMSAPKLEEVDNWFVTRSSLYDRNRDGALDDRELAQGLNNVCVNKKDAAYMNLLKSNIYFFDSVSSDGDSGSKITRNDTRAFSGMVSTMDRDMEKLKATSPGGYEAINFLQNNFRWLDLNKNGILTHNELRQAAKNPNLTESQRMGVGMVDAAFYSIAESTRISRRQRRFDYLTGFDRPISAREIGQFIVNTNDRASYFGFGFLMHPFESGNKVQNYTAIASLRMGGTSSRF